MKLQRLQRLENAHKDAERRRTVETPSFNSEIFGPAVPWLGASQSQLQEQDANAPWTTVWSEPTELQAFVAQYLSDDGWDVTKPKVRQLLKEMVPPDADAEIQEGNNDEEDGTTTTFATLAADLIRNILISLVPVLPTQRPPRENRVPEIRHIEGDRAAGRQRSGWMGANRYASAVDRFEAPRGDRSGRLYTQQAPRCFCGSMMLQV